VIREEDVGPPSLSARSIPSDITTLRLENTHDDENDTDVLGQASARVSSSDHVLHDFIVRQSDVVPQLVIVDHISSPHVLPTRRSDIEVFSQMSSPIHHKPILVHHPVRTTTALHRVSFDRYAASQSSQAPSEPSQAQMDGQQASIGINRADGDDASGVGADMSGNPFNPFEHQQGSIDIVQAPDLDLSDIRQSLPSTNPFESENENDTIYSTGEAAPHGAANAADDGVLEFPFAKYGRGKPLRQSYGVMEHFTVDAFHSERQQHLEKLVDSIAEEDEPSAAIVRLVNRLLLSMKQ
jgi:hypothetical protein